MKHAPEMGVGASSLVSLLSEGKCKLRFSAGGWAAGLSSSVYPQGYYGGNVSCPMGIFHIKWHEGLCFPGSAHMRVVEA